MGIAPGYACLKKEREERKCVVCDGMREQSSVCVCVCWSRLEQRA